MVKNLQKSFGKLDIKVENNNLKNLVQEGCFKAFFPKTYNNYNELVVVNTSGGVTSGDKLEANFDFSNSNMCISTQAAEKIYSGFSLPAKMEPNIFMFMILIICLLKV